MNMGKQLVYAFHILFHPFDGFWDLKHEKRGSARSATILVALLLATYLLMRQFTGFLFRDASAKDMNLFYEVFSVLAPLALWCLTNWGITTLMDGKGTLKDIYCVSAYALAPLILIYLPLIPISHLLSREEAEVYSVLSAVAVIWAAFLMFVGIMTIHQYTVGKTLLTVLIAVVGMMGILFLVLLFVGLLQQLINFMYVFFTELTLRTQ